MTFVKTVKFFKGWEVQKASKALARLEEGCRDDFMAEEQVDDQISALFDDPTDDSTPRYHEWNDFPRHLYLDLVTGTFSQRYQVEDYDMARCSEYSRQSGMPSNSSVLIFRNLATIG